MRLLLVLGLAFGMIVSFASHVGRAKERNECIFVEKTGSGLKVSLATDRRRLKRGDHVNLQAMLVNSNRDNYIFVYGILEWGYSASFTLHVRDAMGKDIQPRFLDDALTPPLTAGDKSSFVKLPPNHFLGTYYYSTLREINMERPGRYRISVEYHCPISAVDVQLNPFWGKENGTIESNVLWVEVIR